MKETVNNYQFTLNATLRWILDYSDLHNIKIDMDLYLIQWPGLHCTVQKMSAMSLTIYIYMYIKVK